MSAPEPNTKEQLTPEASEGPAGVYIHIPFCRTKCPYCSFVSYEKTGVEIKTKYMQALGQQVREIAKHPWVRARKFHSLYVGGGTPSTIEASAMAELITTCVEAFDFGAGGHRGPEVTLEANPNTVSMAMLKQLRQGGVNRLSIGVQSFSDPLLKAIGREHSARDGEQAVEHARASGFTNINLDLMYGLPGQNLASWQNSLARAVALAPEHLSVYELTVEEGTPFAELVKQGKKSLPDEDAVMAMFELAQEVLTANCYRHYEISNYCRRGFACVHNINYWENGSYLGLGAGAVSCFSGVRIKNNENPMDYINMIASKLQPFKEGEFLPRYARFRESMIMGLRMTAGVSTARLQKQFGITPQEYYGEKLAKLKKQGLLRETKNSLHLTKRGLLLANRVMAQLV